jgi:hypothetical protein
MDATSVVVPSGDTRTIRPVSRSLTSAEPSGSRARPHGDTSPEARSATTLTRGASAEGVAGTGPLAGALEAQAARATEARRSGLMRVKERTHPLCGGAAGGAT